MAHVIDRDLGLKAFIRQLEVARTVEVAVGILEGSTNKDGESIAEYGVANEYGTSDGHIPERSFMRTSFDENLSKIKSDMDKQSSRVMSGQTDIRSALSVIGMNHQDRVKKKIGSNIQPKNSDYTIAKKKSSRTLIDNSDMINSVHYVIRGKS